MAFSKSKRTSILNAISKRGMNPVVGTIYQMMGIWLSWYRGNVNKFHKYNVRTVDGINRSCERLTMNMAKKVCEDWTTLLFNEKVQISVNDDDINEKVQQVLRDNNFEVEFSNLLEKSFALGNGVMVEFLMENKIVIDYIIGDKVFVTSYRNNQINGICLVNEYQKAKETITHLTYHTLTNGEYVIEHEVYKGNSKSIGKPTSILEVFSPQEAESLRKEIPIMNENGEVIGSEVKYMVVYETDTAHFQVIKPNIVNNYDIDSPLGISIFANRIDNLKSIDLKYDAFYNEYELAKHRIILDTSVTEKQQKVDAETGTISYVRTFDTQDSVFMGGVLNQDKAIEFYNAEIREDAYEKGIGFDLQNYGFGCGLGTDYYAFDARGVYQNEKAIVSENSDLWASKNKHEIILVKVWEDLVKSILFLLREIGEIQGDITLLEVTVTPDDSIIIDDEARYQKDLEQVDRGMFPEYKFRMKWFGETEQEAKENIALSNKVDEVDLEFNDNVPDDIDE